MRSWLFGNPPASDRDPEDDWAQAGLDGGAAWDQPDDAEFDRPRDERDLHWAFRQPPAASWADEATDDDWASGLERGHARSPSDNWEPEERARLVTVGQPSDDPRPRDPAQPGMFDPEEVFAPPLAPAEPVSLDDVPPPVSIRHHAIRIGAPAPAPAPVAAGPPSLPAASPAATPVASDSVFGDFFAAERRTGAAPGRPLGNVGDDGATRATARDPRYWPPIPDSWLPREPRSLAVPPVVDPFGRRFEWPPPQPRVVAADGIHPPPPSRVVEPDADEANEQEPLWTEANAGRPVAATSPPPARPSPRVGVLAERPPLRQAVTESSTVRIAVTDRTLLTVFVTAAVVLALVVIFSRYLRPLLG